MAKPFSETSKYDIDHQNTIRSCVPLYKFKVMLYTKTIRYSATE